MDAPKRSPIAGRKTRRRGERFSLFIARDVELRGYLLACCASARDVVEVRATQSGCPLGRFDQLIPSFIPFMKASTGFDAQ